MGSMTSRPKVPTYTQQPQVVYVPQYTAPPPVQTTTPTATQEPSDTSSGTNTTVGSDTTTNSGANTEQTVVQSQKNNLLQRDRGRFGLVKTGFRGLLSTIHAQTPQRKTLLGE